MKKTLTLCLLLIAIYSGAQTKLSVPARPNPAKLVNDYVHTLTTTQVKSLENTLVAYEHRSRNQLAVVLVSTTDSMRIDDYALSLFRKWGIGSKNDDNGLLVFLAIKDRKIRIEVGYGLEAAIPDSVARRILDTKFIPALKDGSVYAALQLGLAEIISVLDQHGNSRLNPMPTSMAQGVAIGKIGRKDLEAVKLLSE